MQLNSGVRHYLDGFLRRVFRPNTLRIHTVRKHTVRKYTPRIHDPEIMTRIQEQNIDVI